MREDTLKQSLIYLVVGTFSNELLFPFIYSIEGLLTPVTA